MVRPVLAPSYATVTTIAPDGRIALPGIKEPVDAAGKTVQQLSDALDRLYPASDVLKSPLFTIDLLATANTSVFVGGEVLHPGPVQVESANRTLVQAIMARGGPQSTAQLKDVAIIRVEPDGGLRLYTADLTRLLSGEDLTQNVALSPMDVVIVPKTAIAKVDVWMDQYVRRATPLPLSFLFLFTNSPKFFP